MDITLTNLVKRMKSLFDFSSIKAYVLDKVKFLCPFVSSSQIVDTGNISYAKLFFLLKNPTIH